MNISKPKHNYIYKDRGDHVQVICNPCGIESPLFRKGDQQALVSWCNEHHGYGKRRGKKADQVVLAV